MNHRKSIRLKGYDYAQDGVYFVTLLALRRESLFGDVTGQVMQLSTLGCVVDTYWWTLPEHFSGVELDAFVVMPNHVHGIMVINRWANPVAGVRKVPEADTFTVGATHASPLHRPRGPASGSLGAMVGSYKSAVTREVNQIRQTLGAAVWQRNYYEHIIRSEDALNRIRTYIHTNPSRWSDDMYWDGMST